jgi:hypothetical protein
MGRNLYITLASAALACSSGAAMAQSPVGNPGFDAAFLGQAPPTIGNWASFLGGPPVLKAEVDAAACGCTIVPRTGASALTLIAQGGSDSFVGVQQPVPGISPGVSYTMTFWARSAGPINNAVEFRIEWQDVNGNAIGNQFALTTRIDSSMTATYQQFSLTADAPAGAARANLVFDLQTFAGAFNPVTPVFDTSVFIDDVELIQTPGQNACCAASGSCSVAAIGACPSGSTPLAANSTCTVNNCPQPAPPVACCNSATGFCFMVVPATCTGLGASAGAANSTCSPNPCQPHPVCRADFDGENGLEVADIFAFLNAWFAGCP